MYNVIIVGGGPAGIFSALELVKLHPEWKVALIEKVNKRYSLEDQVSTKTAGFLSQFTCAIQNASEHNIMEFFGDENTAAA